MSVVNYDLAIVGAGPGGLMAAKTAAEEGLKVLVIEKRKDVSKITRACCEQFIMDENYSGDTLRIEPGKVIFAKNGFSVDYDGPSMDVTDKYYLSPQGQVMHFAHEDKRPIVVKFDKGHLLQGLWRQCEQKGVTFMPATVAYGASNCNGEGITLAVSASGIHGSIKARKVIAADGSNTGVAEALGFNKNRTCYATALCLMYYMEGIEGFESTALKTYFGRVYQGLAPIMIGPSIEDPGVGYVICTGNSKYPPPKIFENVTRNGALAPAFRKAKVVKTTGCAIKTFSPLAVPWQGNALVIGDAAAYVEVETQGALMCGYRAGHAVARELAGEPGFDDYTRWWQQSFEFLGDDFMRVAQGFVLVPTYTDDELDYLFGLLEGTVLEGTYNQYKSPRIMWEGILQHRERIQKERPEVYEKITGRQVSLSDML